MTYDIKRTRRRIDRIQRMADVRRILHDLNIEYTEKRYGDIWFKCVIPIHKDKDASAHICAILGHEKHGIWNCFGCQVGGDIIELIRQHLNLEFSESILWAEARLHLDEEIVYRLDTPEPRELPSLPEYFESPENVSEWPTKHLQYLQSRGIPWYQVIRYKLGYCSNGPFSNRIIVPVTLGYELRTWVGRNISNKGQRITSCKHGLPGLFGSQFANPLYGPAILVEGWTDTLRVDRVGFPNVMAIQTNRIHPSQMLFLRPYEYIILMPDGDDGGDRLINAMSEYLDKYEFYIARIPDGLDPAETTDQQIEDAIDGMKKWKPVVTEYDIEIIY